MANPYHDGTGKFCSKGEMQAALKELSKSDDYAAYAELRKSYDAIENSQTRTAEERIEDSYETELRLNTKTPESTQLSYELVKDKVGGDHLGDKSYGHERFASRLMGSRYLTDDQRADLIARATSWDIYRVVENDTYTYSTMNGPSTYRRLSPTDYKNLMARDDTREFMPLIAKNGYVPFEERVSLIGGSSWGTALLAMHNRKEFFANPALVEKLRNYANDGSDKDIVTVHSALADSPHEEDHLKVMNSGYLNSSYPSVAMSLARNRDLSMANGRALIRGQLSMKRGTAASVAYAIKDVNYSKAERFENFDKEKISYNDHQTTEQKKAAIHAEIAALKPEADADFTSEAADKSTYLYGQLYANDSDYKTLQKQYKKLGYKSKPTEEDKNERNAVGFKISRANNIRTLHKILEILDEELNK